MSDSTGIIHLNSVQAPLKSFTIWERRYRHGALHWFVECFAEMLGVFFYVYAGVGSTIVYILGSILQEPGSGSVLQIGIAYSCGVIFAIAMCASTSGGHFNPCVTITLTLFRGFPPLKALRYIVFQILGGYIACLLVYAQYRDMISVAEEALASAGKSVMMFTPNGPAGAFALYVQPGSNLGRVFLNEFVTDFFIAMVIFGCLDPTNIYVSPTLIPVIIGIAYGVAVWGFSAPGLAANTARDLGGRFAALSIWGMEASGGKYAAVAALTNIPATILAFIIHELMLTDYSRVIPGAQREFMMVHHHHAANPNPSSKSNLKTERQAGNSVSSQEKPDIKEIEHSNV